VWLCTEEHCNSPLSVSYRRARAGDFVVAVESGVSDVISGLIDPTQSLRGSWKRWKMPTDPMVTYTYRVDFVRPCPAGWHVERLAFSVEGLDAFQLTVGNHVVVREVRLIRFFGTRPCGLGLKVLITVAHTTFIHQKPVVKRHWINYNACEVNLTKLWTLIQYIKQFRYNFFTVGIAAYRRGHTSREIYVSYCQ